MTIVGTHDAMPKARFAIKPGRVQVIFHPPIDPKDFGSREELMEKVRTAIESGLPEEFRTTATTEATAAHRGTA
jgi:1-acyl-sn-glycerol-3-phosphate acyltransferase